MMHEAIDCFVRHLDVDLAKPIFELLEYRQKNGLTEEQAWEYFQPLVIEENTYRYYLTRMRWELEQLFELTPPFTHRKIRSQINTWPTVLENVINRKNVIKTLKLSNESPSVRYKGPDGSFATIPLDKPREKSEKLNLDLLSTNLFDDYLAVLSSMLYYFQDEVSAFLGEGDNKNNKDEQHQVPLSVFTGPPLKPFMLNWEKFLDKCTEYSKKNIPTSSSNKPAIICMDKRKNKYQWKGAGRNIIPMLGQFITRLEHEDVQILRPNIGKGELAFLFIKFFGLEMRYPNPHYLSTHIRPEAEPKKYFFSDLK